MTDPVARDRPDFAAIRTDLVLSWGHLPSCGEGAEFPWDCTCDYQTRIERMEAVIAAAEAAALRSGEEETAPDPIECAICGDYTVKGVEVHAACLPDRPDVRLALRQLLAAHRDAKDLIEIGAYVPGTNPLVDRAVALQEPIRQFLTQSMDEQSVAAESWQHLAGLVAS